jgi:GC-rich sequence DNA-binding factor
MHSFKKRQKRNFRKKADEDDNIDDESQVGSPNPSSVGDVVQRPNEKSKPVENKKLILSFGHEEEEESNEVFQVKKSAESRRLARQVVKEKKKREKARPEVNTQISAAGEYTAEKLAALKVDSFGKQLTNEPDLLAINASNIPDAATIHAARKRRELARQLGSDFLPLDDTQRLPSRETKSRLVREDDNDISDEEGADRPQVFATVKLSEMLKQKKQSMKDALEDERSEDEDEELKRWEQEQIKKGVTAQQLSSFQSQEQGFGGFQMFSQNELGYAGNTLQNIYPYQSGNNVVPSPLPPPAITEDKVVDVNYILTQLRTNLRSLKEVHSQRRTQADRHGEDGKTAEESAVQLESRSKDVAWRYTFYQDMRGYVRDLLACLHEKVQMIENRGASQS